MTPQGMTRHGDAGDGIGGRPPRIDGAAKIRGQARYALDQEVEGLVHGVLATAAIAAGRVRQVDTGAAEAAPGVLLVLTPQNTPPLRPAATWTGEPTTATEYRPLDPVIRHAGQQVALVVAETLEQATEAAALLRITYEEAPAIADCAAPGAEAGPPLPPLAIQRGDAAAALARAPVRIEAEYRTAREYQAPIEPHGLIARWEGDRLTLWEPSQWLDGMARNYAEWFGLAFEQVRIVSPFIGGGFGSKAIALPHGAITAQAARLLGRPVKLALTRAQNFTGHGGRAATRQRLELGADAEGRLLAIRQQGWQETSQEGGWVEPLNAVTALMYAVPNLSSEQRLVPVHTVTPSAKRAPGENPSAYALECAMDELAHALGLDPLELRLRNEPEHDPHSGKPWSSRRLREAYAAGAAAFGWSRRDPRPGAMREGVQRIGWGMAAGTYPVRRSPGEAMVRILADGGVEVASSTSDMGTGAYTILAQTAASVFGLPLSRVRVTLGDSTLPRAPVSGGSQMAGLMTGAVDKAARAARDALIGLALSDPRSPLCGIANTLSVTDGKLVPLRGEAAPLPIAELLARTGRDRVEALRDTLAENGVAPEDRHRAFTTVSAMRAPTDGDHSMHSWCAHFVELAVDEALGSIRLRRIVTAFDSGLLYNPRLAESQIKGGVVMGVGQALLEGGIVDRRHARLVNGNFADYLLPTQADIPPIEAISVGEPDPHASALGGKGVGELGIVGVAAAIANAVFHATGRRVRHLPITLADLA
ncbi:xanthine dehydrogenase family protein molybdopterin-binding subunit [Pseudoroseomonas cervicalis]|uniref:xanthine dehydrogenase family protein molybdopterin-binding subunit n=1 Tax=Teichococcus cervicalis TaxID=204525 RepID=UPI0022F1C898|nr:xanthine dehydrogenase family protein molybdopterin-binding subunit [Pseudoroseomonas cervicalis]WBV44971.1 xanthine dehydrogenase family protein molybdopterin-binding subunit [Pseudoroseomonas cervicalis]